MLLNACMTNIVFCARNQASAVSSSLLREKYMGDIASAISDKLCLLIALIIVSPIIVFTVIYVAIDYLFYSIFSKIRTLKKT